MEPLSNYSRSASIEKANLLIAAIEDYKNKEVSILALFMI
jgi:hypothetical protein